ncbi:MAG TPA: hypothetical protein VKA70_16160 [Blastocatellia bacterium]|nr:hypothetical protein [Blastocatellia bacterium]
MSELKTRLSDASASKIHQGPFSQTIDVVCLSHLRWDFGHGRPQHLMVRFARTNRVFFIEEPVYLNGLSARLDISRRGDSLFVITPRLPKGLDPRAAAAVERTLVDELVAGRALHDYILWYYTPAALSFTDHLSPLAVVYDCMDEPATGDPLEARLLDRADVVFACGQGHYESLRETHQNVHLFPPGADAFASDQSCDQTWSRMSHHVSAAVRDRLSTFAGAPKAYAKRATSAAFDR